MGTVGKSCECLWIIPHRTLLNFIRRQLFPHLEKHRFYPQHKAVLFKLAAIRLVCRICWNALKTSFVAVIQRSYVNHWNAVFHAACAIVCLQPRLPSITSTNMNCTNQAHETQYATSDEPSSSEVGLINMGIVNTCLHPWYSPC